VEDRFDFRHPVVKPLFSSGGIAVCARTLDLLLALLRIYSSLITRKFPSAGSELLKGGQL